MSKDDSKVFDFEEILWALGLEKPSEMHATDLQVMVDYVVPDPAFPFDVKLEICSAEILDQYPQLKGLNQSDLERLAKKEMTIEGLPIQTQYIRRFFIDIEIGALPLRPISRRRLNRMKVERGIS